MKTCDVLVIGAGIQGAGIAQAAAAAGYRVIILEQYAKPAQGTSSRSSKLIHGGLRYLETGQFSLVKECLRERQRLLRNAPHLVHLVPFYIPVYEHSHYNSVKIMLGLGIYTLFSHKGFRRIPKQQWSSLQGLKQEGLKTVFQYYDAQTDDQALTRSVLESALSLGAKVHFNACFKRATIEPRYCLTEYSRLQKTDTIRSHAIVNAAGPWASEVAQKIPQNHSLPTVELIQGTHIEVPAYHADMSTNTSQGIYYLEAPQDQRAVFVMPWKGHLLIGTTETLYQGDPADVTPLESEISYLLAVYNHYFEHSLSRQDVIRAFAGLRVLPGGDSRAFSRPRDTLIIGDSSARPRLLTLYGGKLTSYRTTAERVMKKLQAVLPEQSGGKQFDTRKLPLP